MAEVVEEGSEEWESKVLAVPGASERVTEIEEELRSASGYGTSGGIELTGALIERYAEEAEQGYDPDTLVPRSVWEEDEPVEAVVQAFEEGERFTTSPPPVIEGDSPSPVDFKDRLVNGLGWTEAEADKFLAQLDEILTRQTDTFTTIFYPYRPKRTDDSSEVSGVEPGEDGAPRPSG